jgi:hypothetical protein
MNGKRAILGLVSLLWAAGARAEGTGAAFLRIGAGTRAAGMGSAFTAAADDATSVYWNPAGLAAVRSREATATHAAWIAGAQYDHLAYAQPASWGGWGAGVTHLSLGTLDGRADDGSPQGSFKAGDTAVGVSVAAFLGGGQGGLTAKWIQQRVADVEASGFAADLGYRHALGKGFTVAATLRNIGPSLRYEESRVPLPLSADAGFQWKPQGDWSLSVETESFLKENRTVIRAGTEYWAFDRMAIRAGYAGEGHRSEKSAAGETGAGSALGVSGFQMGVGLRLGSTRVDYAVASAGAFGETQQVSLSFSF